MTDLTQFLEPVFYSSINKTQYEVIENEAIKSSNLNGLTISGSLFRRATFTGVTFDSCIFFGARMDMCNFVDCKFINCRFEFSHIAHCNFNTTIFENCSWDFSTVSKNEINHSRLCLRTTQVSMNAQNAISNSITADLNISWEEALEVNEPSVSKDETQWSTNLLRFLKAA